MSSVEPMLVQQCGYASLTQTSRRVYAPASGTLLLPNYVVIDAVSRVPRLYVHRSMAVPSPWSWLYLGAWSPERSKLQAPESGRYQPSVLLPHPVEYDNEPITPSPTMAHLNKYIWLCAKSRRGEVRQGKRNRTLHPVAGPHRCAAPYAAAWAAAQAAALAAGLSGRLKQQDVRSAPLPRHPSAARSPSSTP